MENLTKQKYKSLSIEDINFSSFFFLFILFYIFSIFISTNSGEIIVKISRLLVMGFGVLYIVLYRIEVKKIFNIFTIWGIVFLLYHFLKIVLGYTISSENSSAFLLTTFYTYIINIIIVIYLYDNPHKIITVIKTIAIAAFFGVLLIFLKYGFDYYVSSRGEEVNANGVAFKAVIGSLCSLIVCKKNYSKGHFTFLFLAFFFLSILNFIFAVLCASRTMYINFFIPIFFYIILKNTNNILKLIRNITLVLIFTIVIFFLLFNVEPLYLLIGNRIEAMIYGLLGQETDSSTYTRLELIEYGFEFFNFKKIEGSGLDAFRTMMSIYHPNRFAYYAHNNFIEMLVSGGILGFVLYYFIYIIIIKNGIKKIHNKSTVGLYVVGFMLGLIISEYAKITYYETIPQLCLAILYVLSIKIKNDDFIFGQKI